MTRGSSRAHRPVRGGSCGCRRSGTSRRSAAFIRCRALSRSRAAFCRCDSDDCAFRIFLDVFLTIPILPRQRVRRDGAVVLFDQPSDSVPGQAAPDRSQTPSLTSWSGGPNCPPSVQYAARCTCSCFGAPRRLPDVSSPARRTNRNREAAAPAQRRGTSIRKIMTGAYLVQSYIVQSPVLFSCSTGVIVYGSPC